MKYEDPRIRGNATKGLFIAVIYIRNYGRPSSLRNDNVIRYLVRCDGSEGKKNASDIGDLSASSSPTSFEERANFANIVLDDVSSYSVLF